MSEVEFDQDKEFNTMKEEFAVTPQTIDMRHGKMVAWLMQHNVVVSPSSAKFILSGVAIFNFILSIVIGGYFMYS
jgi:hypothetical protein